MSYDIKRDTIIYYLFSFFLGFYIANGTTVLFLQVLDFSYSRIFVLTAVYMLMFIIFEIPSGAFADLLGRKRCVMIGCFSLALGSLATGFSNTFPQVFASYFLWAFGFSMISGANEAMLYDRISDHDKYAKVIGRAHSLALIGTVLAGILGPYLYSLNFRAAYLASSAPFLLAGISMFFFREEFIKHKFTLRSHWEQIITGVKIAFQNRFIIWSIAVTSLAFGIAYTFSNFYQPYLVDVGFAVKAFSFILPVMFVVQALGGMSSGKIYTRLGENKTFALALPLVGVATGALGLYATRASLGILFVYVFLQGLLHPVISTYANKHIESSHRATVISVQGMIGTITASLMLFLFGFLTDRVGINNVLIILGIAVLVGGTLFLFLKPKQTA